MDVWVVRWMEEVDGWKWMDGWMSRWINWWESGWMVGWMAEMDGWLPE